uniref:TsaA-like domain-containing protein n=1 Tax=Guillardia theta TaxID=55529 RepID=A0A7S4N3A8_GUITH
MEMEKTIRQQAMKIQELEHLLVENSMVDGKRGIASSDESQSVDERFWNASDLRRFYSSKPIGFIRTCFPTKNGCPRQGNLAPTSLAKLRVHFGSNPTHSLDGLADFSHLWVFFVFHQNENSTPKPKVYPPRLDGKPKGVFATRSPHRPHPLGLTLSKIDKVEHDVIYLSGVDLVDGTPVIDIKPYIAVYDSPRPSDEVFAPTWSLPEGKRELRVELSEQALMDILVLESSRERPEHFSSWREAVAGLQEMLALDPRSAYRRNKCRDVVYPVYYDRLNVCCKFLDADATHSESVQVMNISLRHGPTDRSLAASLEPLEEPGAQVADENLNARRRRDGRMDLNFSEISVKAGTRLPDALFSSFPQFFPSLSSARKAIRRREILCNNRIATCGTALEQGDRISMLPRKERDRTRIPRSRSSPVRHRSPSNELIALVVRCMASLSRASLRRKPRVLFLDDELVVVEKPEHLPTTFPRGIEGARRRATSEHTDLTTFVTETLQAKGFTTDFIAPCHRLDSATGGLVVFARSRQAAFRISQQFEDRAIGKEYLAVVVGDASRYGLVGTIDREIDGKSAITNFQVLSVRSSRRYGKVTLLLLRPQTGRRHQLRIHLSQLGHPILGDDKYGVSLAHSLLAGRSQWLLQPSGDQVPSKVQWVDSKALSREEAQLLLWASRLSLRHPTTNEELEFESRAPPSFHEGDSK